MPNLPAAPPCKARPDVIRSNTRFRWWPQQIHQR